MAISNATPPLAAATYDVIQHVGLITLNRPESLNAVNAELSAAVGQALESAAGNPEVRAVVITGAGRAFCAGADLKELAQGRSIGAPGNADWGFAGLVRHWIGKPVIAAVNGVALGGGTEIALACDLVVAATTARFGLPEVKRGLLAAAGGVVRLQRQLPLKRALELALTGDSIDAITALEWGLVNRAVSPESVLNIALELAQRIATNAPLSVQHTKLMIHKTGFSGSDWNPIWSNADPWRANTESTREVLHSHDAKEGPAAFAEKRAPRWEGR
jgi:crotonobetainyl-CoA hydratase